MKDERNEIDQVVTFRCQNTIHVYYKGCGVVPAAPFMSHDTVQKAELYFLGCRQIKNPKIIEHKHPDVKKRILELTLPQARELAEVAANNEGASNCLAKLLLSNFTLEELRPQEAEMKPDVTELAYRLIKDDLKQIDFMVQENKNKMILEEAQALWKTLPHVNKHRDWTPAEKFTHGYLLVNFTVEELEGKKGFSWADCFDGGGWYISPNSDVMFSGISSNPTFQNKNVFNVKEQAESALAFAQLSHIVEKYNENKAHGKDMYYYVSLNDSEELEVFRSQQNYMRLGFVQGKDAELSLEVNKELWKKYWMVWDKK